MIVRLKTGTAKYAGTDDPIYIGVSGTAGGREFPLDIAWRDDFERGSDAKYVLGEVWEEAALAGAKRSEMSHLDWNDPKLFYVGFEQIDRVYLRKLSGRTASGDDAWQMDRVEIDLYGDEPSKRVFRCDTAVWLGVQYGLQVWVPEAEDR